MSIESEIKRIENNISDAYDAMEAAGAEMPTTRNSNNLTMTVSNALSNSAGQAYRKLTESLYNEAIAYGTYDGKVIENNEIFTVYDGTFQKFTKTITNKSWKTETAKTRLGRTNISLFYHASAQNGDIIITSPYYGDARKSLDRGVTWTAFNTGSSNPDNANIVYWPKTEKFYAGTRYGLFSTDGSAWTNLGKVNDTYVYPVCANSSVMICTNGYFTNENTFTLYETSWQIVNYDPISEKFNAQLWSNGDFYESTDGINWTLKGKPGQYFNWIARSGNTIVGFRRNGANNTKRYISTDSGTTWTSETFSDQEWFGGAYQGLFYMGRTGAVADFIISTDGLTWTQMNRPDTAGAQALVFVDDKIYMGNYDYYFTTGVDYTYAFVPLSYNKTEINNLIPTVDQVYNELSTNAQSGVAVKQAVDEAVSSVYKPAGSVAFSGLPTLGASYEGYVYNINEEFTTDANFVEGAGKTYPAGTNVVCIDVGSSTYKWDVLSGFVDLTGYVQNTATGTSALTINGTAATDQYATNIGNSSRSSGDGATAFGYMARAIAPSSCAVGAYASTANRYGLAIGYDSHSDALGAIQIGPGSNTTAGTLQIGLSPTGYYGSLVQYQLLNTNGTIPTERLAEIIISGAGNPTTSTTGTIGLLYKNTTSGAIFKCTAIDNTDPQAIEYTWEELGTGGGSGGAETYSNPALTSVSNICTWTVSHTLNTKDFVANVYNISTGKEVMYEGIRTSNSVYTINLQSDTNIVANTYKVVMVKSGGSGGSSSLNTESITIQTTDWSANSYTATVQGMTADKVVWVSPAPSSATDYSTAGILCTAQGTDELTFTCTSTPSNDVTINVIFN